MRPSAVRWLLGALAAVALAANIVLALQSWRGNQAHRAAAFATLNDLAGVALDRYTTAAEGWFRQLGNPLLFPVERPAGAPGSRLAELRDVIAITGERERDPCNCLPVAWGDPFFALEGGDGRQDIAVDRAGKRIAFPASLSTALELILGARDSTARLLLVPLEPAARRIIIATIAPARAGRPQVAYGVRLRDEVLASQVLAPAFGSVRMVPRLLSSDVTNAEYLSIVVKAPSGRVLYRSPIAHLSPYGDTLRLPARRGGLSYEAVLNPRYANQLVAGGIPKPPVGPIALTLAVTLIALFAVGWTAWWSLELARLRTDFTSSVSHELRTPLTQIRLSAETLLLGRVRSEGERQAALEGVVAEAARMQELVENVLHFARAERHLVRVRPVRIELKPVVEAAALDFAPIARQQGATVLCTVPRALTALADPIGLRQVLHNLLDNAVRYGPAGGTITIDASLEGTEVRVGVADDGRGIPHHERERVWRPFERLATVAETNTSGTGLGLAVVGELVRAMGGRCRIADRETGCRVDIFLPTGG
ncbi:MAG: HAMP domain-containing histidine kinase [Gemmatimonadales bacterium]|nr:HAMP domain-containing histidine kinase [Gemmatimonadales bacterium]